MVRGWGVTQEVLPKQAPEAAETNERETTLKSVKIKKTKPKKAELSSSKSAEKQRHKHTGAFDRIYTKSKINYMWGNFTIPAQMYV